MLFLSDAQVGQLLNPREVIVGIERAFARDYPGAVHMPTRMQMETPGGVLLLMPCYDRALPAMGIKLVFVREGGGPGGRVQATYALLDPATGSLIALLDAAYLTELRTAATSAIATKFLARKDSTTLGIFGTGRQARAHLTVLPEVLPFKRALCLRLLASAQRRVRPQPSRGHEARTGGGTHPGDAIRRHLHLHHLTRSAL